ncbi:hypothetical protein QC764_0087190 [Podospora pseudoanserina]|uniref:Uncharacterized protein n=1 Tax=Podospora pseudoanserina TaxID=2609844 RepID=A0ABR0I7Y1_9PEZI|nr:hypothetical protein QC764_0087190 [Podospora pseudoanserina]
MSNARPNNLKRKRLREICRYLLTQHISKMLYSAAVNRSANATIEERTDISIKPSEVRLLTSRDNGYSWQYLTELKHLFFRNISKYSIGAYRELCAGLGKKFEAVPSVISSSEISSQPSHIFPPEPIGEVEVSFSSRITQLATEIDNLRQRLSEVYKQLITETSLRETLGTGLGKTVASLAAIAIMRLVELNNSEVKQDRETEIPKASRKICLESTLRRLL